MSRNNNILPEKTSFCAYCEAELCHMNRTKQNGITVLIKNKNEFENEYGPAQGLIHNNLGSLLYADFFFMYLCLSSKCKTPEIKKH